MEQKTLFPNDVWTLCRFKPNWLFVDSNQTDFLSLQTNQTFCRYETAFAVFLTKPTVSLQIVSVSRCNIKALSPTTLPNWTLIEKRLSQVVIHQNSTFPNSTLIEKRKSQVVIHQRSTFLNRHSKWGSLALSLTSKKIAEMRSTKLTFGS